MRYGNYKFSDLPDGNGDGIPDAFDKLLKRPKTLLLYLVLFLFVANVPGLIIFLVFAKTKPGQLFLREWKQALIKGSPHSSAHRVSHVTKHPTAQKNPMSSKGDGVRVILFILLVVILLLVYFFR